MKEMEDSDILLNTIVEGYLLGRSLDSGCPKSVLEAISSGDKEYFKEDNFLNALNKCFNIDPGVDDIPEEIVRIIQESKIAHQYIPILVLSCLPLYRSKWFDIVDTIYDVAKQTTDDLSVITDTLKLVCTIGWIVNDPGDLSQYLERLFDNDFEDLSCLTTAVEKGIYLYLTSYSLANSFHRLLSLKSTENHSDIQAIIINLLYNSKQFRRICDLETDDLGLGEKFPLSPYVEKMGNDRKWYGHQRMDGYYNWADWTVRDPKIEVIGTKDGPFKREIEMLDWFDKNFSRQGLSNAVQGFYIDNGIYSTFDNDSWRVKDILWENRIVNIYCCHHWCDIFIGFKDQVFDIVRDDRNYFFYRSLGLNIPTNKAKNKGRYLGDCLDDTSILFHINGPISLLEEYDYYLSRFDEACLEQNFTSVSFYPIIKGTKDRSISDTSFSETIFFNTSDSDNPRINAIKALRLMKSYFPSELIISPPIFKYGMTVINTKNDETYEK